MIRFVTNKIVIHHSVMPQGWSKEKAMPAILSAHRSERLAYDGRISYHWIIGDGWQAQGRPDNTVGYHAGNWLTNLSSVAICLMGNFNNDKLTAYQEKALTEKLWDYMAEYSLKQKAIKLHRDFKATACPGRNIDLPLIYQLLDTGISITDEFIKVWGKIPAHGEYLYFEKRLKDGSIEGVHDLRVKMHYWHDVVYPKGRYSKEGDNKWQRAKAKNV